MAETDTDRAWNMMQTISICMLANWDGENLQARPMMAYARRDENAVLLLTDVRDHKDEQIARFPAVCLAFADTRGQNYVSLSGRADILADRTLIGQLWSTPAKAWWDSPDDPNIRVLKVTPTDAEYWDGPGTTIAKVKMAIAAMSGTRPNLGDSKKVAM